MKRALLVSTAVLLFAITSSLRGSYTYVPLSNYYEGTNGSNENYYYPSSENYGEIALTLSLGTPGSFEGIYVDWGWLRFYIGSSWITVYAWECVRYCGGGSEVDGFAGVANVSAAVSNGSAFRFVAGASGIYGVYLNGALVASGPIPAETTLAQPPILVAGYWAGLTDLGPTTQSGGTWSPADNNWFSSMEYAALYTTTPTAPPNLTASAGYNYVDLQWSAANDGANGPGIYQYEVYRGSQWLCTVLATSSLTCSDTTVVPNDTYTYTVYAMDYQLNSSSGASITVTTEQIPGNPPYPSTTPDGRDVGVRTTGTYWGANGENLDMRSGNVNFAVPLLRPQGRGTWSVPFNLIYNSQNWRQDSGGTWVFDGDVGYGWGWRLMAGSLTMIPQAGGGANIAYFLYTDSTGAEYRLSQSSNNIWSSPESVYVWFDANANILHFRDGSFWTMGCVSASTEADAGVMHPTLMEDSNGNQVTITYLTAPGAGWSNSSARISQITDVRATSGHTTYSFTYNSDSPPHLTSITNSISSGENYSFSYSENQTLYSPFSGASYGTAALLSSATISNIGTPYQFTYDGSAEITLITFPYKGKFGYAYSTVAYPSGKSYRSFNSRYWQSNGSTNNSVNFVMTVGSGSDIPQQTELQESSSGSVKDWYFATSGTYDGLVTEYLASDYPSYRGRLENQFTWTQDSTGNSYISSTVTTADPSQSYQAQKQTNQTLDIYGNVLQLVYYNWGNLSSAYLTENFSYLSSSAYTSRYIYNRMTSSPTTTVSYDSGGLASVSPTPPQWDTSVQNVTARGNPTSVSGPSGVTSVRYDVTGTANSMTVNGVATAVSTTTATNWAAPSSLTVGSLEQTMSYSSFLGLTSTTGPNGASVSIGYDAMARPTSVTSPFGAVTTTTYNDTASPPTVVTSVNGRWSQQNLDGFGRTILTLTGYGSGGGATTVSQAETVYAPCGCSPTGKMTQQAVPHAPNATPAYTTYSYDSLGRTTSVVAPDGASTTTYSYQGNTVTVTDPAGAWKTFATDALGNLLQVTEPNPAGGSNYVTTYTYDILGHVLTVSMPRPSGTQARSFTYSGNYLTSATNPENGTVNYTYNNYYKVATRTDAKNQQVQYTYDSYARLTQVQRYPQGSGNAADPCQQENYYYDSNPFSSSYSQNVLGRLAAVQYYGGDAPPSSPGPFVCDTTFTEMYSYSAAGGVAGKQLEATRNIPVGVSPNQSQTPLTVSLAGTFAYDNEGRMTSEQYPLSGPNMAFTYNSMGQPNSAEDQNNNSAGVTSATYGPAGQLLQMNGNNYYGGFGTQTFAYNSMLQLTQLTGATTVGNVINIQYNYSSNQNNGKIMSQTDLISGEQVNYTYDALNRLATAETSPNSNVTQWGQSFTYDGFGNLTNVNVIAGSAPTYSANYNTSNQQQYDCPDANGNLGVPCQYHAGGNWYDVENRLTTTSYNSSGPNFYYYSYAPGNKRVWRGSWESEENGCSEITWQRGTDEVTFWAPNGQKLATYALAVSYANPPQDMEDPTFFATQTGYYYYFGGRMIKNENGWVYPDRLGSIGKFYPYGTERPSATTNGTEKFTGYFRDAETGNDYADRRYHLPGQGRFMTPDPYRANAGGPGDPANPGTWNKYAYVAGDPVNRFDRTGLLFESPDCPVDDPSCNPVEGDPGGCEDFGDGGGDVGPCNDQDQTPAPQQVTQSASQPKCVQVLTSQVSSFLSAEDPKLLAWDPQLATQLVAYGQQDGIDPRLMAAIATLESGRGSTFGGTNNPFGLGPGYNYGSPDAAVASLGITLEHLKGYGDTTVAKLYSGLPGIPKAGGGFAQPPGYCQSSVPGCKAAGVTVSNFLSSFLGVPTVGLAPGDPNNLAFPCP
jgi:RHS repeat-associated protein